MPSGPTVAGPQADEVGVSPLELFFDLVFVFTLTQLTAYLEHHLTIEGAIRVVLMFGVLFWMYGGYVWLTNQLPPLDTPRRLLLIGGMAGFLVCALAIPDAFGATGLAFGIGYLVVVLVHSGLYAKGHGRAVWRFAPFNIAGALCVIAAAAVDGMIVQYALWIAPIALQLVEARLAARVDESSRAGYDVRPGHFVERNGLLLLIAFGESVIAIGVGVSGEPLTAPDIGGAVLALGLIAALWWTFFGGDQERAEAVLTTAPVATRVRMALGAYFYAFIPLLLGVVVLAAGLHLALDDLGAPLDFVEALLLGGGVALYLVGDIVYRLALGLGPLAPRALAMAAALGTIALGTRVSALAQVVGLVVILVLLIMSESRSRSQGRWARLRDDARHTTPATRGGMDMLNGATAFSGFSTNDIAAARSFYRDTLGLDVNEGEEGLSLRFAGGQRVFIYPKDDHRPATFTVLDIEVGDLDRTVDGLIAAGVRFEQYGGGFGQDARGVARNEWGPPIAWFTDPAGNIIALIETTGEPM